MECPSCQMEMDNSEMCPQCKNCQNCCTCDSMEENGGDMDEGDDE